MIKTNFFPGKTYHLQTVPFSNPDDLHGGTVLVVELFNFRTICWRRSACVKWRWELFWQHTC